MKLYLAKDLTGPPKIRKNRVSIFVRVCVGQTDTASRICSVTLITKNTNEPFTVNQLANLTEHTNWSQVIQPSH